MKGLRRAALAVVLALGVLVAGVSSAGAAGTYKTYTGQAYDYTQEYCYGGACVVPTVTFTSRFETTLTNPPYGYVCKTPNMDIGQAGNRCWSFANGLWGGQVVELISVCNRWDAPGRVVKMAFGLKGDTKPTRIGFYIADGEHATAAEENSTGYC